MSEERLAMLEQRRIEAAVVKPIYEKMKSRFGLETAPEILRAAITNSAVAAGKEFAREFENGADLLAFQEIGRPWLKGGALEKDDLEQSDREYHFNVTRYRFDPSAED